MEKKPNRPMHYQKKEKDLTGKTYFSLRALATEIFPDLSEVQAYRKSLKNFKRACEALGEDYEAYKSGSSYHIPTNRKSAFVILIRHVDIYEAKKPFIHQDYKKISELSQSLIEIKKEIDNYFNDDNILGDLGDYVNFYNMFYSENDTNVLIIHEYHKALIQAINKDFRFVLEKVPNDRKVLYAEEYYKKLTKDINKRSEYIHTLFSFLPER